MSALGRRYCTRDPPYTLLAIVLPSVAARGLSGESHRCPSVETCTATEDERRTQLALWVGGQGTLHFTMGNQRGKGVLLEGEGFPEGVWTHLAVSVEGREVFWLLMVCDGW